ncbi:hypothetical protein BY458DRAFT_547798 [Sporodiniella umbellata]|nr:hypothetical protein BY458DRAFT_547798 [Sporodiniella umbellata]
MFLTRDEFKASLSNFYDQQRKLQLDEWEWEEDANDVYLKKTSYLQVSVDTVDIFIKVEYHIVYSVSYRAPMLYFLPSYYQDGSPLSLDDIYQHIVPKSFHKNLKENHYVPCISQTEHSLLRMPIWYIHPCETSVLMETVLCNRDNYIKAWLSFVGPVVRYYVPKELFET